MLDIIRLYDSKTKKAVARGILEALPEWFGIAEAREEYIAQSAAEPFWCAYDGDKPIGFLYIHQTGDATLELYAMGVLKDTTVWAQARHYSPRHMNMRAQTAIALFR